MTEYYDVVGTFDEAIVKNNFSTAESEKDFTALGEIFYEIGYRLMKPVGESSTVYVLEWGERED